MDASRYAIGDDRFVERTEAGIEERRKGGDADRDSALPRRVRPIGEIDGAVAQYFEENLAALLLHNRNNHC